MNAGQQKKRLAMGMTSSQSQIDSVPVFPSTSELDEPSKPRNSSSVSSPDKSAGMPHRIWEEYRETSP